ncbi:MAG: LytTR family DNA-binding domain-containing protein [Bacteroidota bacterium]
MKQRYKAIIIDDEKAARDVLADHLSKIEVMEVVGLCKNAIEGFSILNTEKIDVIFLDINMPEVSGLSFAKTLNKNTKVIFTTAYREYAVDGFDLQAVDYILKPISLERLIKAVNKFLGENIPEIRTSVQEIISPPSEFIFVRSDRKMIKVNFTDIAYIESLTDYIKIITSEKSIITRETISNIEAKLPHEGFLRCHRSFVVSIAKITSFTSEYLEIGKKAIPISRSYKKEVLQRLEGN